KYKTRFEPEFPSDWQKITLSILDYQDRLFALGLITPGGNANYSEMTFNWLSDELQIKTNTAREAGIADIDDRRFTIFNQFCEATGNPTFEDIFVLRKGFIHEPVETVNDIPKYLHWLEHSVNVEENQRILRAFSTNLSQGKFKEAVVQNTASAGEVIKELDREISKVNFDVKTSKMIVQAGATLGGALGGAALGSALSAGDIATLFGMCGAVAASKLTDALSHDIVKQLGRMVYNNNPAFLIWQRRSKE
ncbi:MAG: hypothetical protein HOF23_08595, partial [Rhodospirillaceae bacterium]|nr:hypothetical protein [Rhodospirillaceae bacterium]